MDSRLRWPSSLSVKGNSIHVSIHNHQKKIICNMHQQGENKKKTMLLSWGAYIYNYIYIIIYIIIYIYMFIYLSIDLTYVNIDILLLNRYFIYYIKYIILDKLILCYVMLYHIISYDTKLYYIHVISKMIYIYNYNISKQTYICISSSSSSSSSPSPSPSPSSSSSSSSPSSSSYHISKK